MKEIIRDSSKGPDTKYYISCQICHSEFTYQQEDLINKWYSLVECIECPVCNSVVKADKRLSPRVHG